MAWRIAGGDIYQQRQTSAKNSISDCGGAAGVRRHGGVNISADICAHASRSICAQANSAAPDVTDGLGDAISLASAVLAGTACSAIGKFCRAWSVGANALASSSRGRAIRSVFVSRGLLAMDVRGGAGGATNLALLHAPGTRSGDMNAASMERIIGAPARHARGKRTGRGYAHQLALFLHLAIAII